MKKYLWLILLLASLPGFGQIITAPAPLSIEANASNVDAGDFVINWANNTDQLLVSISLDYRSTATFSMPTTTGLTLNTGYTAWTNITSVVFYGYRDQINTALAAMTISMGATKTALKINLEVSQYDAAYVYNPTNKHFYRYITSSAITYANAKSGAATYSFRGKTGYLVTITSQSEQDFINTNISGNNIWISITDQVTDGTWVIDSGPELGTVLKTQNGPTAGNIAGQYNNWCSGEPNGANHSEDFAVAKWNSGTCWNDLPNSWGSVAGYIVEISEDFPAGTAYTGVYAAYAVHNNDLAYSLSSTSILSSSNTSNLPNVFGGLQLNNGNTYTLNSGKTLNTNKVVFTGTGKLVLTDNTSKWTPGTANGTDTFIFSPSTNSTPKYWSTSSSWVNDSFYENAPHPSTTTGYHFTPWINSPQGWSASANDGNQWIALNYDVPCYIAGIVTQGRNSSAQWVTAANVDVSLDGTTWKRVLTGANLNTNYTEGLSTYFPSVEYAKYVRVNPTNYAGFTTMRLGLIIKQKKVVSDGLVMHLDASNPNSYQGTWSVWKDLSGNLNHVNLQNSPTYNVPDRGYFTFNGSTQYMSGPAIASTSGNNSRTVMVWYKSTAFTNTTLLDKGTANSSTSIAEQLFLVNTNGAGTGTTLPAGNIGGVAICFWGNDLYYPISASTIFDGKWHFIAYTYNSSNTSVSFCFDGKFPVQFYYWNGTWSTQNSNPFTLSYALNTTSNPIYIGYTRALFWGYGSTYANASIPQMLIYNRALSNDEILTNYNATKATYGK